MKGRTHLTYENPFESHFCDIFDLLERCINCIFPVVEKISSFHFPSIDWWWTSKKSFGGLISVKLHFWPTSVKALEQKKSENYWFECVFPCKCQVWWKAETKIKYFFLSHNLRFWVLSQVKLFEICHNLSF